MPTDLGGPAIWRRRSVLASLGALAAVATDGVLASPARPGGLPAWSPGELDIYHINTGGGNSTFFILPDGTTMLLDAGDLDRTRFAERSKPLQLAPRRPSEDITPGAAIVAFVRHVMPHGAAPRIDYALISHFHDDHYGGVRPGLKRAESGDFQLTGMTEVGAGLPIGTLIDRAFPDYGRRLDPRQMADSSFLNYRAFQMWAQARGTRLERLVPGSSGQIILLHDASRFPTFRIRNIKSSEELATADGQVMSLFGPLDPRNADGRLNENVQSLAFVLSYGAFDYFSGGDNTGLSGPGVPDWLDIESRMAAAVGPVDVLTLNHHGNRDATNAAFLAALKPRVLVQQGWVSDQPGSEVVHRMASRSLWDGPRTAFSTALADGTRAAIGPVVDQVYSSGEGHILIRVEPGGNRYRVYVLDDRGVIPTVRAVFGPYESGSGQKEQRNETTDQAE